MATGIDRLTRGRVWCVTCGRMQNVDPEWQMRHGWPKCCGHTMTIDSPQERAEAKAAPGEEAARG